MELFNEIVRTERCWMAYFDCDTDSPAVSSRLSTYSPAAATSQPAEGHRGTSIMLYEIVISIISLLSLRSNTKVSNKAEGSITLS